MSGTLYIVATPIGHLDDCSVRALHCLRTVAAIAAEDTRHTRKLLTHYDIHTPIVSYHAHSGPQAAAKLLARLQAGEDLALVSDAGTPGIADPGTALVRAARQAGAPVVPIPGPCAAIAALMAAGLPTQQFTFVGFLPERPGRRRRVLAMLAVLPHTVVLYLARWDVAKYLREMVPIFGSRSAVLCRELTKQFEESRDGSLEDLLAWAEATAPRGEFTLVIAAADEGIDPEASEVVPT